MPSTMISSNTRASRSRYSSPQQAAPAANEPAKSSAKEEQKTFMQRWLEPPVQSKASFQEAGLMRHGVVENMAPLGTLPKAAASKKHGVVAGQEHTPIRKIVLKQRQGAAAHSPSTPLVPESEDFTPAPTRRSVSSRDVDDDDDYDPKGTFHSSGRPKATRRSLGRPSAHRLSSSSSTLQQTTANSPARVQDNKETIDRVVEAAVDEALDHFRYPTAWALRTLYDENSSNPHFVSMIEQVYHQTADPETIEEFARLVHEKKKEGKEDNKGCYYFVPPTTNSRFTPHKPKPAPYTDLLTLDVSKVSAEGEVHPRKKVKHSSVHESARKMATNGVNGTANASPSRNRGRGGSVGSDSSLSSAKSVSPPPVGIDEDEEDDVFGVPVGAERTSSAETTSNAPGPAARQPIAARHRSRATTKNNGDVLNTPTPTLDSPSTAPPPTNTTAAAAAAPGMPAAVASPLFPKLSKNKGKNQNAASDIKFPSRFGVAEDDERQHRLRRFARSVTNTPGATSLSWERPHARDPEVDSDFETPGRASSVRPRASLPPSAVSARATRSQKRHHDDADDEVSPTSLLFPPDVGVDSGVNSRAVTPLPRPNKKPRTGPRIKTSPMKKKNGPSAGIPRASGERTSPPLNGQPNNQDENDDYCSSCGGNGELVCCDGCTRSFHLTCVDPPMEEGHLPDEWYCHVCFSQRFPTRVPDYGGVFGYLLNNLEKKNSSAFRLPTDVRDYFEGVKTGADGEYEEIVPTGKTKKKGGVEEVLDFWKVRDAEGQAIICHRCQSAAAKDRAIMPCSLCGLHWHLDCLDPPAANAPVPRTFRCPAHVDDLLARVPGALGPAHKFRKIKGASAIKPAYSRGLVNNGYIDVDGEDVSEDESGWKEVETFGKMYRLPSKGIKLDFFSHAREVNRTTSHRPAAHPQSVAAATPVTRGPISVPVDQVEIDRQQAALNLVRFSSGDREAASTLINVLLDNADPAVVSMIARGNSDRTAEALEQLDRVSLMVMMEQMQAMQQRIRERLSAPTLSPSVPNSAQETPVNGVPDVTTPQPIENATSADQDMEDEDISTELKAVTPSANDRIPTPENSAQSRAEESVNQVSPRAADVAADTLEPGKLTPDAAQSPQDPPKVNSDVLTPAATEPDSGMDTGANDEVHEHAQSLDTAMDLD